MMQSNNLKALEIARNDIRKIAEKYKIKAEKERAKVSCAYVTVQGEKCHTKKEIFEWYEGGYITEEQYDRYAARLEEKQTKAGQDGEYTTQSEHVFNILNNTVLDYTTEIADIKRREDQEQKRMERCKEAQARGMSYQEWLDLEAINEQSEEYELIGMAGGTKKDE